MQLDSAHMQRSDRWRKAPASDAASASEDARSLLDALEPEQLSDARRQPRYGRRALGSGTMVVLWALRIYVVLMALLVLHQLIVAL